MTQQLCPTSMERHNTKHKEEEEGVWIPPLALCSLSVAFQHNLARSLNIKHVTVVLYKDGLEVIALPGARRYGKKTKKTKADFFKLNPVFHFNLLLIISNKQNSH